MADTPQQQPPSNKIDDYLLINPIATGKTAQIWEVLHEQSGQMYAMKLLLPEAMLDQDAKNDLKHEAKVGEGLEHPNLIRFRGLVMRKTECYILMELFKTPNLKSWIRNDPVGLHSRFRKMAEGVCMALSHMHGKGWIHKDIKPENILLNRMGEVRVIDFSLAVRKASALSSLMGGGKGTIQGTRTYLAPETIRKEPSTIATDIYSLGVTFFECLTGQPPFAGTTPQDLLHKHIAMPPSVPSTLNSNISPEMDALILKMLAKKPKDRPQSCDDLLAEIRKIQPFKEEVVEGQSAQKDSTVEGGLEAELDRLMVNRRDSRADAQVQALLRKYPELHQMFLEKKAQQKAREEAERVERERRAGVLRKELDEKAAPKAAPEGKPKKSPKPPTIVNAPPAAYPPGMAWPQQPMPGYPMPVAGMPYGMPPQPGMAWPQQPMPGTPMPGMPWSGQYMPPGMPPQMMPGYPPQPGMAYPPGQIPPQGMPQQPVPPAAAPAQPVRPSPVRRPTPPPPAQHGSDLPLMTDLPDVE